MTEVQQLLSIWPSDIIVYYHCQMSWEIMKTHGKAVAKIPEHNTGIKQQRKALNIDFSHMNTKY